MKKIAIALTVSGALVLFFFLITRVTVRGGSYKSVELENHHRTIDASAFTFWITLTTFEDNPTFQLEEKDTKFTFDGDESLSAVLSHPVRERKLKNGLHEVILYLYPDINGDHKRVELTEFPVGNYSLNLEYTINGKEYEVTHDANFYHKRDLKGSAFFGF